MTGLVVRFYQNAPLVNQIGSDHIIDVPAGQNVTVTQAWISSEGTHVLFVIADPPDTTGGSIGESNETNNSLSQVLPQIAFPDLTITAISWQPVDVLHGSIVTLAATVENSGAGATSREFYVRFAVDGNLVGRQKVSGLGSNIRV